MIIHLYAMCLNEEQMIPFFFEHYRNIVNKFVIYDNGSTDGTLKLLSGDERVSVREFKTSPSSFVESARVLLDSVWKQSRSEADWVIIVEMDEHLHHHDLAAYVRHCTATGITAIRSIGYEMVSDILPAGPSPLYEQVTSGFRAPQMDKFSIFRPDSIVSTNFGWGRHFDSPRGKIVYEPFRQVKLLHFKHLSVDYVCNRNTTLAKGLRNDDLEKGWGSQYLIDRQRVEQNFALLRRLARRVPGLAEGPNQGLTMDEERRLIQESGYFDAGHYLRVNKDVDRHDPLLHFCCFGWKENRNPNNIFDMSWYRKTYGHLFAADANPLLDYIIVGRHHNRMPSIGFDPRFYRLQNGLPSDADPLGHCIRSRKNLVSRLYRRLWTAVRRRKTA